MAHTDALLTVKDLKKYYPVTRGIFRKRYAEIKAVDGIDFEIEVGKTLALVGESGCGKTTVAKCVIRLQQPTAGDVVFRGKNLSEVHGLELKRIRRHVQMVFQDPYASLDPVRKVGDTIGEPLRIHRVAADSRKLKAEVAELLRLVGLEPRMADRYPHEFSGGQRQKIAIARALALKPSLVICDEPVSALDVSTQTQITQLLVDLQSRLGLAYLLISHDLPVVRQMSDYVVVMYLGKVVEAGEAREICEQPRHPYTQALISAVPLSDPSIERRRKRIVLQGEVPSAMEVPAGCRFHTRCWLAKSGVCDVNAPELRKLGEGRSIACHLVD